MIVLLFGPPGCGKGTQASLIASRFRIPTISTGDLLRAEIHADTPLGRQASVILHQGGLVGDSIVNPMVAARVRQPDCADGFLLDGYPRTLDQAAFLDSLLPETGLPDPVVIHLDVPIHVLVRRTRMRRQCARCSRIYNLLSTPPRVDGLCDADGGALVCRPDDAEHVVRERLKAYRQLTGAVISHYRDRQYHRLNGDRPAENVRRDVEHLLLRVLERQSAPTRAARRVVRVRSAVGVTA
jgi:adenylate kinase